MSRFAGRLPAVVRRRYLTKFALVVGVVMVLVAIGGYAMVTEATGTLEAQQQSQVGATAQLNANQTEQWVENYRQTVRMVSQYKEPRDGNVSGTQTRIDRDIQELPEATQAIHYVSISGEIRASTDRSVIGDLLGSLDIEWQKSLFFRSSQATRISYVHEQDGRRLVSFVSPIEGPSAAIMITVNMSAQADSFRTGIAGSETQVVRQNGTVEFDDDPENVFTEYRYADLLPALDDENGTGTGTVQDAATGQLLAYAPVDETKWTLVTHVPTSEAYAVADTIQRNVLIVIGLALGGFLFVGATIGRSTVRSLETLATKARELEAGNLETEVESDRVDELGQLFTAFGEMRDALRTQIQQAESAQKEAEVSRAEAMAMSESLQERAEEYSEIMQACARGDLTQRMDPDGETESMDRIAEEFNQMISELELTTGQLKTFASEVKAGGRGVQQSADTVRDASEQVAESVQTISDDAYEQRERLQSISEEMDGVAEDLEQFADEHPEIDFDASLATISEVARTLEEASSLGEATMAESERVAGAAEELVQSAEYLGAGLENFETDAEHEFVFQTGANGDGHAEET